MPCCLFCGVMYHFSEHMWSSNKCRFVLIVTQKLQRIGVAFRRNRFSVVSGPYANLTTFSLSGRSQALPPLQSVVMVMGILFTCMHVYIYKCKYIQSHTLTHTHAHFIRFKQEGRPSRVKDHNPQRRIFGSTLTLFQTLTLTLILTLTLT